MFTATWIQALTYLCGVCLFSISFLVFLNSSVSFVITDLLKQEKGVGDAVGTLGFADELVALVACPLWGVASDRLGARIVSTCGCILALVDVIPRHTTEGFLIFNNIYRRTLLDCPKRSLILGG